MNKETDLFSLATDIEISCTRLEEIDTLIDILDNEIEEGCASEKEPWRAIHHATRTPRRLALLRSIQRELDLQIKELTKASDQLLEMHRASACTTPPT